MLMMIAYIDSLVSIMQKRADYGDRFKQDEILKIFLQVCKAVAHMHEQNPPITHRDLKVENVLVVNDTFKLCDFGSCTTTVYTLQDKNEKLRAEEDIQKNTTMAYRSPEMADLYSGYTIDEKSDVWALGCVLYKMCYFVGPFEEASTLQIINCKYRIPDNSYSSDITDLIKYMLIVDPAKRPSVFDIIEKVSKLLGVESTVSRPAPRQNQPSMFLQLPVL
jgi:AP2-associated kinase